MTKNIVAPQITLQTLATSIDDLAIAVAKGFKETNGRLSDLEIRFTGLEGRMDGLDGRMDRLDDRMDGLEGRMGGIEDHMGGIESRLVNIEQNMATKDDIARLETKFDSLEKVVFKDHAPRIRRLERKAQIA